MNETIAMPGRVSKLIMQKVFVEQGILDEDRIEEPGIEVEHLTTAETLSEVSEPLEAWIRHYQLGKAPKSVGKVKLPMIPLLNSLASGDTPTLDDWFEVLTEKDGSLIRQTNNLQAVPHKAKVLIFPFIERIIMMGLLPLPCNSLTTTLGSAKWFCNRCSA